ncbi:MAG: 2,3-bisphosphoglycerate-dependent phosphoglycerate mutase [Bdellovibrionaceae bacterium]|nr:2,3-bisphosphoglycerate-dependent phosphoglycerate mutase [Pseudobdellovibrionaceae bacterium]
MIYLTLMRHGQSEWNKKNLFTGWTDVDLSEKGKKEAKQAGIDLKRKNVLFQKAFSSALQRSIQTMEIVLKTINLQIPFVKAWQLNERHYGQLQGQNKKELMDKFGKDQVQKWRRSFTVAPPPIEKDQKLKNQDLYQTLKEVPKSESLQDTQNRVLPFWNNTIYPFIAKHQSVLIIAHGNSLRALIKKIEAISDEDIPSIEFKTGRPLIYEMDKDANILKKEIL